MKKFKDEFFGSGKETTPVGHEADPEALETEIEQEKIVKQRR